MTKRSEFAQRKAEAQARLMARMANRVLSTKESGFDGVAKSLAAKRVGGEVPHDPELDHDAYEESGTFPP